MKGSSLPARRIRLTALPPHIGPKPVFRAGMAQMRFWPDTPPDEKSGSGNDGLRLWKRHEKARADLVRTFSPYRATVHLRHPLGDGQPQTVS